MCMMIIMRKELLIDRIYQTRILGLEARIHYVPRRKHYEISIYDNQDRESKRPLVTPEYKIYRDEAIAAAKAMAKSDF